MELRLWNRLHLLTTWAGGWLAACRGALCCAFAPGVFWCSETHTLESAVIIQLWAPWGSEVIIERGKFLIFNYDGVKELTLRLDTRRMPRSSGYVCVGVYDTLFIHKPTCFMSAGERMTRLCWDVDFKLPSWQSIGNHFIHHTNSEAAWFLVESKCCLLKRHLRYEDRSLQQFSNFFNFWIYLNLPWLLKQQMRSHLEQSTIKWLISLGPG